MNQKLIIFLLSFSIFIYFISFGLPCGTLVLINYSPHLEFDYIQNLKVGDYIIACNFKNDWVNNKPHLYFSKIQKIKITKTNKYFSFNLSNCCFYLTEFERIYNATRKKFIFSSDINSQDEILNHIGNKRKINATSIYTNDNTINNYNLTLEDSNMFFIGDSSCNSILVNSKDN
ncbi:hypothetical protein GF322_00130 [Candidatus Dependentiae bacterium]|nr:hypothetical protein [Candidatus Dependentiae bacterium]